MRILSLFSGIGAFEKALTNLGVPFTLVNYCEIDKYASKSYSAIHGVSEDLNLGDITKIDTDKLADFDLMTWGFPCQDISVAGKQSGIEVGTRSGLYYEGMRILRAKRPSISIVENVKNLVSKKFQEQFKQILRDHWELGYYTFFKVLNAKDYGIPQNRERVFVIAIQHDYYNKHFKQNGKEFEWPLPFDNGLSLKDMLENEVDEKYYISDDKVQKLLGQLDKCNREYSHSICASVGRTTEREYFKKNQGQLCAALTPDRAEKRQLNFKKEYKFAEKRTNEMIEKLGYLPDMWNPYNKAEINEVAPTLTSMCDRSCSSATVLLKTGQDRHGVMTNDCKCVGRIEGINGHDYLKRVYSEYGTSPTIPTCCGRNHEPKVLVKEATKQGYAIAEPGDSINIQFPNSETRRGRVGHGVAQTVETSCNQATIVKTHSEYVDKKYEEFYKENGYYPELFNPYNKTELTEYSPTLTAQGDSVTKSGTVLKMERTICDGDWGDEFLGADITVRPSETYRIRKLTPTECFRLMAFSDTDIQKCIDAGISNSQLYKQAGNSICVNVLEEIFKKLLGG